ncbi:hypothetical protein KIK06_11975 [Nocardiopsis sp. EMB25]|uniref:hypothetical protein n=1 Tax=Nocardiopsis TaxID=2013 RepID=UPI0003450CD4|nr:MULTISPECIES: hypothetical protein [Nocardiopsis]MCY9784609.1 hypothetical protein [Nocardiopsis sp. EMB25]
MPSHEHEFPLDLIRHDPEFAAELLHEVTGKSLPAYTRVRCDAAEATSTALPYVSFSALKGRRRPAGCRIDLPRPDNSLGIVRGG